VDSHEPRTTRPQLDWRRSPSCCSGRGCYHAGKDALARSAQADFKEAHISSSLDDDLELVAVNCRLRAFAVTSVSCPTNPISALLLTVKSKLALLH